jgi:hypothetical protein
MCLVHGRIPEKKVYGHTADKVGNGRLMKEIVLPS